MALYGECYNPTLKHVNIVDDIDRPILALLGDSDEDGDASECVPRFEKAKAAGAPIRWHVFANTSHAWDSDMFAIPVTRPYPAAKSGRVRFEYSRDATRQTEKMLLDFLAQSMPAR
ncbi:MAG: dienelactone hydrolase family protein [Rhodospirillales bacterium]